MMTIGFSFLPSIRDPLKLYMQNLILDIFDRNYHQEMFTYLALFRKIGTFLFGTIISLVLMKLSLQHVLIILLALSLPIIYISIDVIKQINNIVKVQGTKS